ncbi:hypothetical protein BUALT_Bualt06G0001800 [Buddleja alternifolia]|uniref:WRKY domain-containing protein n=1 Tax=Buddleja alternifolia TaxID=168488 RepID=A0AAV6XMA2_9LAMI|nr:hypothetical protein BUALT_Bualt06G0001800 [Buddleja alternifolia]
MEANGGGPPFIDASRTRGHVKKEEEIDSKTILLENHAENNSNKGISIAERRAAKSGFNVSNINEARFRTSGLVPPVRSPYFTIPPGISPSALLDSPIMLPNAQAQLSPTTGTFQFPSPNPESLELKLKLIATNEDNNVATDQSSSNNLRVGNKMFEEFEYQNFQKMAKKNSLEDSLAKTEGLANKFRQEEERPDNTTASIGQNYQILSHNVHNSKEKHPKTSYFPKEIAKYSEDGYYWRKYGQKHVKGSEFPRSYYKCTNTNCPVKKKVERSHDGQITEIVYKGSHNHSKPQPSKRFGEISEITEGSGSCIKPEPGKDLVFSSDCMPDNGLDVTSSTSFFNDFSDPLSRTFEPVDQSHEFSSTFNDQDDASLESISINNEDDENGECEPKKRSYYKCTTPGCPVRKHVERAANDIKSVITTYEGKHNHEVPSSKTGSLVISDVANLPPAVTNSTVSTPSSMTHKQNVPKVGKQMQDLPLYMERKPILHYNGLTRSNLPGNFTSDLNFGSSSVYPLSFPPFHSLPYGSLMMNGNPHMKTYPSSNLYPMLPDYMSLPSPINHVPGSSNVPPTVGGNFNFGNYSALQNSIRGQEIRECHSKTLKPKEEKRDNGDIYDA